MSSSQKTAQKKSSSTSTAIKSKPKNPSPDPASGGTIRRFSQEEIQKMREARIKALRANNPKNILVGDFIQEVVAPQKIAERVALYDKAGYDLVEIVSTKGFPVLLLEKRDRTIPKADPKILDKLLGSDTIKLDLTKLAK